jgi:hypothetical protein
VIIVLLTIRRHTLVNKAEQVGLKKPHGDLAAEMAAKIGISFHKNRSESSQAVVIALANKENRTPKEEHIYKSALAYLEFAINGTAPEDQTDGD